MLAASSCSSVMSGPTPISKMEEAVKHNRVACVELLLVDPRVDLMTRDRFKRSKRNVKR